MNYYVYCLDWTALGGKVYVGYTNNLDRRILSHFRQDTLPGRAYRKYGVPDIRVLGLYNNKQEALDAEIREIARLGTLHPEGYNHTTGGETPTISEDTNKRKSQALLGRKRTDADREAISRGRKGIVFSDETRQRMSESAKRRSRDPEVRHRMGASMRGKRHSEETRLMMREAQRTRWAIRKLQKDYPAFHKASPRTRSALVALRMQARA